MPRTRRLHQWQRSTTSVRGRVRGWDLRNPDSTPIVPWRWDHAPVAESPFGPPSRWPDDDLIGVSHAIDELLTVSAYAHGVFPMPTQRGLMGWYSPVWRAVLPLDRLRVTRSLRKVLGRYQIRIDTAFDAVLAGCADPRRPNGWIDDDISAVYRRLHERGIVHSVEAWTLDNQLAGGLYGVSIGG